MIDLTKPDPAPLSHVDYIRLLRTADAKIATLKGALREIGIARRNSPKARIPATLEMKINIGESILAGMDR